MATISQFHAPSSRATLVGARWLKFLCAHCVGTFGQVTVDPFKPSSFVGRPSCVLSRLAKEFPSMPTLTSDIAAFVTSVEAGALPERCSYGARIGMVDCVGVMIAGAGEPAVQLIAATVAASTQNDGAPEIPSGRNLAAADAALVNGVAAHALDYDDVGMDGHPSAALTPAILAEGWSLVRQRQRGNRSLRSGLRGLGAVTGDRARPPA
jgi:MmgE/PrpD N-terminal domain